MMLSFKRTTCECVVLLLMLSNMVGCAGFIGGYRFKVPISEAKVLNIKDSSNLLVATIRDPEAIRAFDLAAGQVDRWFDDMFGSEAPEYTVELIGDNGWIGTLSIFPRRIHYIPGKAGARINAPKHDELLRLLGLSESPGSNGKPAHWPGR